MGLLAEDCSSAGSAEENACAPLLRSTPLSQVEIDGSNKEPGRNTPESIEFVTDDVDGEFGELHSTGDADFEECFCVVFMGNLFFNFEDDA